ncbi:hypothetical protein PFISCL1PPCAC_28452, partial [Pristionchus fissidentatus]
NSITGFDGSTMSYDGNILKCAVAGKIIKLDNKLYDELFCSESLGWTDNNNRVKEKTASFSIECEEKGEL